jgi:hypothetical protein
MKTKPLALGLIIFAWVALLALKTRSVSLASFAAQASDSAWLQVGADGSYVIKAITAGSACPELSVDGRVAPSWQTRGPSDADFPVSVCEVKMPASAGTISVAGQPLPMPVANPHRILILGDTGCRLKGDKIQDCNDPSKWPFAQLAQAAANWQPELVIHVGDYHYRETECPIADERCKGSFSRDNWESWDQDFFIPAKTLLLAAPWVFVRGNHELCNRGGRGWSKFLDLAPYLGTCLDHTHPYNAAPYWIAIGDHRAAVLDSADDCNIQPSLNQLKVPDQTLVWLFLHRPFLTTGADDELACTAATFPDSLQGSVSAVFTGHQHHLSLNHFPDSRPPELISGNGGTKLDKTSPSDPRVVAREYYDFGFLTLERTNAQNWSVTEHDRAGKEVFSCDLVEALHKSAVLTCSP